ncbi:hypothetical protein DH2020_037459 [Rehmannia glutinosa]|uniref:Endonuclease/exonuclease/phosphatase domain-containing protein n=1 Tax=Rehmannia glutinosa TaxID=99300 RepID=A0ABR0V2J7_REHGL
MEEISKEKKANKEFRRLVSERKPGLLFISETKVVDSKCSRWKEILGYEGCFFVNCQGKSGGLCLLWRQPFTVSIKSYTVGHIDCIVVENEKVWRFTGFYGNPDTNQRKFSWELLRRLHRNQELNALPWLVGGDFNEICQECEKVGGRSRARAQMVAFCDVLEECELRDIMCGGDFFTWVGKRSQTEIIFEKLDRFVCTEEWRQLYPVARATSLEFYGSDHRPLEIIIGPVHSRHGQLPYQRKKRLI